MWFYRVLFALAAPLLVSALVWRVLTGRENMASLRERLGLAPGRANVPTIWLHAASNGELASVLPVIREIQALRPDTGWLVTTNSITGRDMARAAGFDALCAPWDTGRAARRLIRRWQIAALITIEAELWPARHTALARAHLPVILLGARISERTGRGWARLPALARAVLRPVVLALPQDTASAGRLRALGLASGKIAPPVDLKAHYAPGQIMPDPERAEVFLAASTHAGEEEIVIDGYKAARAQLPGLRLILAPRHAARGDAVSALLDAAGLAHSRRSKGAVPAGPVFLADSMGEMALWYDRAGICLVGGSLVDRGGHTPHEPAAHGCAILHGPHLSNFAAAYGALQQAGATREIRDAADLARALLDLAGADAQREMAAKARQALAQEAVGTGKGPAALARRIAQALPGAPERPTDTQQAPTNRRR